MKKYRITSIFITVYIATVFIFPLTTASAEADNSYNYSYWGKAVASPGGFTAAETLNGRQLGVGNMQEPSDIYADKSGRVYIADSGKNRVIILDSSLKLEMVMENFTINGKSSPLNNPQGVFADGQGSIYIADTGNKRVVKCNTQGEIVVVYGKPDSKIEFSGIDFLPRKILVDSSGYVFVLCKGIYQGAVLYRNDGEFLSYFGTNPVEMNPARLIEYYWKRIMTNEQRSKVRKFVPEEYNNFDMDDKGFIYTVTEVTANSINQVKKMNNLGVDVQKSSSRVQTQYKGRYGDLQLKWYEGKTLKSRLVDISYDAGGFIDVLDQERGRIFQYDTDGNLLFVSGSLGSQAGTFDKPVALANIGSDVLVLDAGKSNITRLTLTEYGHSIREATALYHSGRFMEAKDLWLKVLRLNGNCELAYAGIGKVYYEEGDFTKAMKYFKLGYDRDNYGKAFKRYRDERIRSIMPALLTVAVSLLVIYLGYILVKRSRVMMKRYRG